MGELGRKFRQHMVLRGFAAATKESYESAMVAQLRAPAPEPAPEGESSAERILRLTSVDVTVCPVCGKGHLAPIGMLPHARDGPAR